MMFKYRCKKCNKDFTYSEEDMTLERDFQPWNGEYEEWNMVQCPHCLNWNDLP